MRTTLNIDSEVLEDARRRARARGVALGVLITDALRLDADQQRASVDRPEIPTFDGTGLRPGVDLTSNRELQRLLDDGQELDRLR